MIKAIFIILGIYVALLAIAIPAFIWRVYRDINERRKDNAHLWK